MPIGRPVARVTITAEQLVELEAWSRRGKTAQALAMRSRIVLLAAEGCNNKPIAPQLSTTAQTVGKWRGRFLSAGCDGLLDEPRPGTSRKLSDRQVELGAYTHSGESTGSCDALVNARHGQSLRTESVEHQPHLAGLFPRPPSRRNIQAFSRSAVHRKGARHRRPVSRSAGSCPGVMRGREVADSGVGSYCPSAAHTPRTDRTPHPTHHVRHGTTSLFAALDAKSRRIDRAKTQRRHRSVNFVTSSTRLKRTCRQNWKYT